MNKIRKYITNNPATWDNDIENPDKYPKPKFIREIKSKHEGYLKQIDNYEIGIAGAVLGAGRTKIDEKIDPKAGIIFYPGIGDKIKKGDLIAELHSSSKEKINEAAEKIYSALYFSDQKVKKLKMIKKTIT